jgi:tetratricopeptide (TPR) repeat protein
MTFATPKVWCLEIAKVLVTPNVNAVNAIMAKINIILALVFMLPPEKIFFIRDLFNFIITKYTAFLGIIFVESDVSSDNSSSNLLHPRPLINYLSATVHSTMNVPKQQSLQEQVSTGSLNLDKGINKFYHCISKTHEVIDPHAVDALTRKARALYGLANYTGAIKYYDKALAIDQKYLSALDGKGASLLYLGNYTGALVYFDRALAIDPKYVLALTGKGNALNGLGNYTGALVYFDKVLTINPHAPYALNNKGMILDILGNHTGAIVYFDKALRIEPKAIFILESKGTTLDELKNYTGAMVYFDKALAINPKNVLGLDGKAATLVKLGTC